jgi:hypothetical protein
MKFGENRGAGIAYYTICGLRERFDSRENVSGLRNALGKIFLETLFKQNLSFHGATFGLTAVFAVFYRGFFYG